MNRSQREWGPSRYSYGSGLRLRLNLPINGELPTYPQTLWIGYGDKALRVDIRVADCTETPWGSHES
jgi:hypothetical protein